LTINLKTASSQTLQISSIKFDPTVFNTETGVEYTPQYGHSYGQNTQPIHEVKVNASYALRNTMDWVSNYGPMLQQLSYSDIGVLKDLVNMAQTVNNQIDMTNPHVLKAFETFLVVARLHSQVQVNG